MSNPTSAHPTLLGTVFSAPINILASICLGILSAIRPFAPKLVPVLVCILFIPLVLLLSASAGWVVWSNLSISWKVPLYLQYGDGVPPYAFVPLPTLNPHQRYDIYVDLLLPYTQSNIAVGNFMTSLMLSTPNNKTIAHVRRPAIALPPPSRILLPKKSVSHLSIPLLESFIAGKTNLVANVELGRRDSWTTLGSGQGQEVNVISASLRGLAIPHGIRGLAIRFPLLSAVMSAGLFFTIISLIIGTCVLPLLLPTPRDEGEDALPEEPKADDSVNSPLKLGNSKESRRGRRSRSNKSPTERTIKAESPTEPISPLEEPSSSSRGLRRRSSRPVIKYSDDEN